MCHLMTGMLATERGLAAAASAATTNHEARVAMASMRAQ